MVFPGSVMGTIKVEIGYEALNGLVQKLEKLSDGAEEMCKRAIYDGGKVVGNEMKRQIKTIPVVSDHPGSHREEKYTGATQAQIDGLVESMGLAPIQYYGRGLNTKIGFDGYNSIKTKKYPKGQPNMMIARSINSGTSFRNKFPFVERAGNNAKALAEASMAVSLQKAIDAVVDE